MTNFAFMTEAKDPANGNHFSLRRACHPPGQCYFQALSWTGCGSCACRWEPGVAEEAVRSDCPLSVLACKMDRVDEKCLFHVSYFLLPISFYGVKSWQSTRKLSRYVEENLTLLCVSVLSLHEKSSQERIK